MERLKHACFMHVSAHFMRPNPESFMHEISSNNIEELKFHVCHMHDSWNMHVGIWDIFQVWDMHGLVHKFHACFMQETCMKRMHIQGIV